MPGTGSSPGLKLLGRLGLVRDSWSSVLERTAAASEGLTMWVPMLMLGAAWKLWPVPWSCSTPSTVSQARRQLATRWPPSSLCIGEKLTEPRAALIRTVRGQSPAKIAWRRSLRLPAASVKSRTRWICASSSISARCSRTRLACDASRTFLTASSSSSRRRSAWAAVSEVPGEGLGVSEAIDVSTAIRPEARVTPATAPHPREGS
mmetsp:Transcript_116558/g.250429  ORF Transcript_116558/g.250429 Transcript_116558/m.250429 type:complete len:205 (+) Transcript_116558:966-1580(+)